jgi:hypothetical protein
MEHQKYRYIWDVSAVVDVCYMFAERSDLSFIGTEGGEQAVWEEKRTARRRTE